MDEYYFLPLSLLESMKVMTEIKMDGSSTSVMAGDAVKCGSQNPATEFHAGPIFRWFGVRMNSHTAQHQAGCEQGDKCLRLQGGIRGIT